MRHHTAWKMITYYIFQHVNYLMFSLFGLKRSKIVAIKLTKDIKSKRFRYNSFELSITTINIFPKINRVPNKTN